MACAYSWEQNDCMSNRLLNMKMQALTESHEPKFRSGQKWLHTSLRH